MDSGASMHMISKKDLSKAEMDILTKSCSPTIVIAANGEVQTHEEAIVYVKELDIFLTMKVLENTPAVLSLGKLCDENGYSYEFSLNSCNHSGISESHRFPRSIVVSFLFGFGILLAWISSGFPDLSSTNSDTGTGEMSLLGASSLSRI